MRVHDPHTKPVVEVNGLYKKFCKDMRWSMWYGVQDLVRHDKSDLRKYEFWALNDINLTVQKGQSIGLVGRNGSGKTTLMRMISQLMPPTKGTVDVAGKVTPIFRLRSGMHPHYTGRDYVYIQGAMHGMDKARIDEQFDRILDFSELEEFIDAPVGTYSSGMKARLGYSIAIASDFDLLIIDEALAVGDTDFRQKCIANLKTISREKALIFVSHNLDMIRDISNTLVVMEKGQILQATHDVEAGLETYQRYQPRKDPPTPTHIIPQPKQPEKNLPEQPLSNQLELISLHIPKTAGTSFRQVLQTVYGDRLSKLDIRNDQLLLDDKLYFGSALPERTSVIHGHFFYPNLKQYISLSPDVPIITWLRDPVERVISNYYYLSKRMAEELQEEEKGLNIRMKMQRSLLEFAQTEFARNRISRFLDGIELEALFFVGLVEHYEEDLTLLGRKLSWPRIKMPEVNQTGMAKIEVDATTREQIAALNADDVALYEKALSIRGKRQ